MIPTRTRAAHGVRAPTARARRTAMVAFRRAGTIRGQRHAKLLLGIAEIPHHGAQGKSERCELRMPKCECRMNPMSEELKKRTKKFALDVIKLCSGIPDARETRHAIGQAIRSSSSTAAYYGSACRAKSKADFISELGTVEEEADKSCRESPRKHSGTLLHFRESAERNDRTHC